ncbi:hypothetical protein QYE77_03720 [Thermanaerothrix sp. 4228-RoL]|uniref:Glycosyltransferase RgtA/B/C/D-like domain-containing protein n=1 Tax=Thermanaerothrix solaris TaxID=3058434 RepID=A0ABU3NN17_9CHLR|nr:hypothetical protein [Thermanaerothrix sp. 4228-RoL]MDT8897362.1 hypothetical protein [Thermanaerothrix sp. 4228-RoL]
MTSKSTLLFNVLGIIGLGVCLGGITTWVMTGGLDVQGFLASSLLFCLAGGTFYGLWRWSGRERWLGRVIIAAFLVRLMLGVGLTLGLPHWGYDTPQQNLGYLYYDAFRRDQEAWALATSSEPVLSALGGRYVSDQYGGMLAVSALVYRYLSPEQHRPWLILILTAWAGVIGLPFLARALKREVFQRSRHLAVMILAFYPEALFLAASQMRDPFLIAFGSVILWALWDQESRLQTRIGGGLLALGVMGVFSWLAAGVWLLVLLSGGLIFYLARLKVKRGWQWVGIGLGVLVILGLVAFGGWLERVALWDAYLTQRGSGWVQKLLGELPTFLELPFIVAYGVFQPVLPGAIFDPSLPVWNAISTLRALGWYAVLPFLFYAPWALRHVREHSWRFVLLWLIGLAWGWTILASLRAGGDLWDNPRYRAMLLPTFALTVAWVYYLARGARDPWLGRWLTVEGMGLIFFTEWYVSRTYRVLPRLPFWVMVGAIVSLASLILIGGWWWDRRQAKRVDSLEDQPPES